MLNFATKKIHLLMGRLSKIMATQTSNVNDTRIQVIPDMPLVNAVPSADTSSNEVAQNNLTENTPAFTAKHSETLYELPFNEKVRTFVRLESLFNEIDYKLQGTSVWDSRSVIQSLMALLNVFSRPDIKTDLMKEMDRMNNVLSKYESMSGVNMGRLRDIKHELLKMTKSLRAFEGQVGQNLKLNELITAIRQRDSLPGGALGIDVPAYAYWLGQSIEVRNADIRSWLEEFELIRRSVDLVLRLIRETAIESQVVANRGVYQHVLEAGTMVQIVGVVLPQNVAYFPEISGGRHRYTVRFLKPMGVAERPVQLEQDVPFKIICCVL